MQILSWLAVGSTYILMVWGNAVTLAPVSSTPTPIESGYRVLTLVTAILIIFTLCKSILPSSSSDPSLKRPARIALGLFVLQALFGGFTVLVGHSPLMSVLQFIISSFLLSSLISLACVAKWKNPVIQMSSPKVKKLATAGFYALLFQFVLGSFLRNTNGGLACPRFPMCLDSFFPIPFFLETALAFFHRWWGVLLLGLFAHLPIAAKKFAPSLKGATRLTLVLAILQIIVGIGTVASHLNSHSRITHGAIGYALWGCLSYVAIRAGAIRWL